MSGLLVWLFIHRVNMSLWLGVQNCPGGRLIVEMYVFYRKIILHGKEWHGSVLPSVAISKEGRLAVTFCITI